MKISSQVTLAVIIFLFSSCVTVQYLGSAFSPTQHVDIFVNASDIKRAYTTMGNASANIGLGGYNKVQEKMIEAAELKGADAILYTGVNTQYTGTTNNASTDVQPNKNNKGYTTSSSSSSQVNTQKIVTAQFLKYQ